MRIATWLFLAALLVPGLFLAVTAFRRAEQDFRSGREQLQRELRREADLRAERIGFEIATQQAPAVAFLERVRAGESLGLSANDRPLLFLDSSGVVDRRFPTHHSDVSVDTEDLFYLSLSGGEQYEFVDRDLRLARDAYSFYLPQIDAPDLRDRLRFRTARVAAGLGDLDVAAAIWRDLVEQPTLAAEGGLPVPLLAVQRLAQRQLSLPTLDPLVLFLRENRPWIRASALTDVAALLDAMTDTSNAVPLGPVAQAQETLERAITAATSPGDSVWWDGGVTTSLLLADADGARRAVTWTPVELAEVLLGAVNDPRYAQEITAPLLGDDEEATVTVPITLADATIAGLRVVDRQWPERVQVLRERRSILQGVVAVAALLVLAAGAALVVLVERQRRVAQFRKQLLANVSHELRTPLTSIRLFGELLSDDPSDSERTQRFGRLLQVEGQRLSQLVDNLLEASVVERGDSIDTTVVSLPSLVQSIGDVFAPRADEQGASFSVDLPNETSTDRVVRTDAASVERIVFNLLDNALKYGSVDNEASAAIILRLTWNSDHATIAVEDNGPGIPVAAQERVFEEFYRCEYTDYAVTGSGLGLYLARGLARRLGGNLTVESRAGEGSCFELQLPFTNGSTEEIR